MLNLRKIAVTGGLSCGKSSVCRFFKELGAYVVSSDEIVHRLLSPNTNLGQQVIRLLGDDIIVNGQIDRSIIADKVFNNSVLLLSLEKLLHPAVLSEIEKQYQQIKNRADIPLFVAEVPLLYEISGEKNFDNVVTVWSEPELCRKRFTETTGNKDDEYDRRMARQLSPEEKIKRADFVIRNCGSMEDMRNAVVTIFNKINSKTSL